MPGPMIKRAAFWCFIPGIFLAFVCCAEKTEVKSAWIHPIKEDGIHIFKMNTFSSQGSFSGEWSAPRLGGDRRFFRSLRKPGGRIFFTAPRKESYTLQVHTQDGPGKYSIRIQDKLISVDRGDRELALDSEQINAAQNTLEFLVEEEIRVFSVAVFPRRTIKSETAGTDFKKEDFFLLPGSLKYYLKPLPGEELLLCLDLGRMKKMDARIVFREPGRTRESDVQIESNRDFKIRPVPGEFQEIQVRPEGEEGVFLKVKKSLLLSRVDISKRQKMKTAARNKNILLICLDAARSDHFSFNGYARKTTPHIDQLAARSWVWKNAHSEAAYTLASSATLATGLPPDSHHVLSAFFSSLRPDLTTLAELFSRKGYFTAALSANPYFGKAYRLDQGFAEFRELFEGERQVLAEEFIEPFREMVGRARGRPFFICLHIREPHRDYLMPPPFLGSFQNTHVRPSEAYTKKMLEILQGENVSKEDLALLRDLYDENLLYADSAVGRLLQVLGEMKIEKQTVQIITADHGEALGEHGLVGHNVVLHREGLHIPLILHLPGIPPQVTDRPAITSDIVVTLAELFELEFPYRASSRGRNLFSLPSERRRISRALNSASGFPGYAVDQYPCKLIVYLPHDAEISQLHNLQDDPQEDINLTGPGLVRDTLFYYLYDYLKASEKTPQQTEKANLSERELEQLKSLGYIK
jgi:arylsulfatase A-like enzyme